jgi:hypothetical protein
LISKDNEVQPLVPIDAYVEAKAGVCRHFALLGCHFLYRLMKDNLADCIGVHHVRAMVKSRKTLAGHTWMMFQTSNNEWVHLDPMWKLVLKLTPANYNTLCVTYGDAAIDSVLKKLMVDPVHYREEHRSEYECSRFAMGNN